MTFISDIAKKILAENEGALEKVTIVFPNRRAGLFLTKAIGELVEKPTRLPNILSMEDFVRRHTQLQKIETLEAVFLLYDVYKKYRSTDESFDQFFFWGEMIVRDFDEIDQYLVNPTQLFTSIKSQKELDEEFYFLSEEERETILKFWNTFLPQATKTQEAFLQTWKILLPVYEDFKTSLLSQNKAYGGLIYRQVAEQVSATHDADEKIYFAGYNALTFAEEKILKHYVKEEGAQILWDIDDYYFRDRKQEAGFFLRSYASDSVLQKTFSKEQPARFKQKKELQATGVSLEIGQVKALAEKLVVLSAQPDFRPERVVIVLPKEHMLLPVLHALPDQIEKINITMGYPLKDTPVFSLLESLLFLQFNRTDDLYGSKYYYKPVVDLLNHPLIFSLENDSIRAVIKSIKKGNLIRLQMEDGLQFEHPLLKTIFSKPDSAFDYLKTILQGLHETWKDKDHDLELQFILSFYQHISHLEKMMGDRVTDLSYDFLIKLFRRLARSLKVPFTGEPLSGLQIMGILETRNLDFDHVFILNMNEDSWPAPPKKGSFIPYNIRKAFDLPVHDHQDAIYSYLFYRLLQRADKIDFFYNTVSEFNVNGEISRLVKQLEFESNYTIDYKLLSNPIQTIPPEAITITKDDLIRQKLARFLEGYEGKDQSRLTPSALSVYLDCKLKFYFKYVEKLYEPDEVQEEMDPMLFGNILHNSMEMLYKNFLGKDKARVVQSQDIFWIREGVETVINKEFIKHYGIKHTKKFKLEGRSIIAADILKKFINKILDFDEAYAPFQILGLEAGTKEGYTVSYPISIQGQKSVVQLKGIIDRIDIKDGVVRVLDYKTGRDVKVFGHIDELFSSEKRDAKAIFQVFFYAYLFEANSKVEYKAIETGVFNSKDLFDSQFDWRIVQKESRSNSVSIKEWRRFKTDFDNRLGKLLHEIFNVEIPFDQTEDFKRCGYCTYKEICNR